jgi:hypothetical protein
MKRITLTGRNREVFLEALQNPPKIGPKLAAALRQLEEPLHVTDRSGAAPRDAQAGKVRKRKRTST